MLCVKRLRSAGAPCVCCDCWLPRALFLRHVSRARHVGFCQWDRVWRAWTLGWWFGLSSLLSVWGPFLLGAPLGCFGVIADSVLLIVVRLTGTTL